jgi:hypothetical protein
MILEGVESRIVSRSVSTNRAVRLAVCCASVRTCVEGSYDNGEAAPI